jgi:hypothetical protein
MTDKMTLLYLKQTGHVLGAVTRVADPDGEITPEALAQGGLFVRGLAANQQFEIQPEQLDVLTVDLQEVALLNPRGFIVNEEDQTAEELQPGGSSALNASTVTATRVTVNLAASPATTTEVKVWVQIQGGNLTQPQIVSGKIAAGAVTVDLQIETLSPGQYVLLTVATGRMPRVDTDSV